MNHQKRARILRPIIEKASTSLSDEDALNAVELFPIWAIAVSYDKDTRVQYNNKLYRCEQAHTSQQGWEPPVVPALWTEVAKPGEIPVWKQPTGVQDAYRIDDLVHYPDMDGPVYRCIADYNIYAPDVFGWEVVK